ncbi:hypothetical protein Tco_1336805 [Tanacetum coccineum]
MDITRDQQIALDDALVAPANRLKIGKSNLRLSSDLNSKEATLQVVYDVLKLTPFYKAFQITADVPEIYMQEFWATAIRNASNIPKLPYQQFAKLPFEEEILTFLRDLGHSGEIKVITDVNVNKLHQPWRSFAAVINKCLSGKSTRYDSLRLSQTQILWGMYHKKNVDYAYLLWEEFVYQVENKNVKRSNEMYYPRFTKVIVNFFMTKDSSIPRRNRVNWHFAKDDPMFTTIKVLSRHEDTQLYGANFPNKLTNEAIKDSESYKEYYAIASGAEPLKTKASVKKKQAEFDKTKTPPTTKGKRLKTSAKAAKPAKKKQPAKTSKAKGLTVLSEAALTEAEQMELATKRSLIQTHSSHASGSGTDEGPGDKLRVPDVSIYSSNDDQISWKSNNDDQEDDVNDHTDSNNNGDEFFHPKLSTHDQEVRHNEEESDEESDEEIQGANVEEEELDEEATNDEDETNELYRDVNQSSSESSGFISNMLNPSPDTGIDSIFNINTESTSLINVSVTTIAEPPLLSTTTLPSPPTPLITHLQQTPVPTPTTVPSSSLQDLPNFGSLFGFDHRLKTLENDFSKFNQMNQFVAAVSSIPGIIDAYLANKMHKAVKIPQPIWIELKEDFIDKMESNKSIHISDEQNNLYKALVDAYKSDKLILDTYGDTVSTPKVKTSKTTGKSTKGSKSHHKSSGESAQAEEPRHTTKDLEEPAHLEFETGCYMKYHLIERPSQLPDCLVELEYFFEEVYKETTDQLDWNNPEVPVSYDKHALRVISHWGRKRQQFYRFAANRESARDVYSKCRIIAITKLQIVKWHNYKHLDWITVRRDDDKLYKFKEGDFNKLRIQDIEDMLLLLVQGKMTNLTY